MQSDDSKLRSRKLNACRYPFAVIAPYESSHLRRRQSIPRYSPRQGIQVLSRSQPISHLAATHQVSRKFIYQQGDKAQRSLDETFASSQVDAASTYCYLLKGVEHRDEDTWGCHLLDVMRQGFDPDYTIADGGSGLRAVMPETPCHGDVFHIQQQFEQVANGLARQAQGATTQRVKLEQTIAKAKLSGGMTQKLTIQQVKANRREVRLVARAQDVKILCQWFSHDVLALASPNLAVRQELFDFIEAELQQRAGKQYPTIRKLRKVLHNQRDQLLAFAGVIDQKLTEIARDFELPLQALRDVYLLHRKHKISDAYWERWNQLWSQLSGKFYDVMQAVDAALRQTPRASSMVENLNSRLRNYFFLRRTLGDDYLSLLQFFSNHRQFLRSRVSERVGKSPKELLTGKPHPHWLELLGFERFQRA